MIEPNLIQVRDVIIYENLPFDKYLEAPQKSFSSIKNKGESFKPTSKMNLGSQVDNYMNEPERFDGDLKIIRPVANSLKQEAGVLYNHFKRQVSIFAKFVFNGNVMEYKGRTDWLLKGKLLIDTKVAEDIHKTMYFFDYPNQIAGYCISTNTPVGLILAVSPKTLKVDNIKPAFNQNWWKHQIMRLGKPIQQYYY